MAKDFKTQAQRQSLQDLMSGTAPEVTPAEEIKTEQPAAADPVKDDRFDKQQKAVYYRFNLKMPLEYEEYLKTAAIKASLSAGRQITVTEYINMLIREDMRVHGE